MLRKNISRKGELSARYVKYKHVVTRFPLRHKEACEQLEKGRELFTRVLAPLAQLGKGWTHVGLVCCPKVESRGELVEAGLSEEQAQVDLKAFTLL